MLRALIAIGLGLWATDLSAQTGVWPERAVRVIVPFAAGSSPDLVTRVVTERLNQRLGQPFVVENKPGAGGMTGTDQMAKAVPDGYTLGVSIGGPLVNNTMLFEHMPYDPFTEITPITVLAQQPSVLVVSASMGAKTLAEVLAKLRANPGKYNYGSIGLGSISHLAMELLAEKSGTEIIHVPYPGSPQAVQALLTGEVQLGCLPASSVAGQAGDGKIILIAQSAAKRASTLPDLPTFAELGIEGVEAVGWNALVGPAKLPEALVKRISTETIAVLNDPVTRERLRAQLIDTVANTPEQFRAFMLEERERWRPIIVSRHIRLD